MFAEGRDAAARRADQRRKAAADVDMQAHRRLGARQRDHDHVVEVGDFEADRGHAVALGQLVEPGLHEIGEVAVLQNGARNGSMPVPRL